MLDFGPDIWIAAFLVTLAAGVVKGMLGFALPLLMIAGLTVFMGPDAALGLLLLPTLMSNLLQALRGGLEGVMIIFRAYWRFLLALWAAIILSSNLYTSFSQSQLFLTIGVPITILAGLQLAGWRPRIEDRLRVWMDTGVGFVAGFLGGLSATWGPPTTLYLTARATPKALQVQAQGVVYTSGSLLLIGSHLGSGVLNPETAWGSALLLIPTFAGMWVGFWLNSRIDQALFRKLTLVVVALAGLNFIRRGVLGV